MFKHNQTAPGFRELGAIDAVLDSLESVSIVTPTPVQKETIPAACAGKDIIAIAQTGTGKTIAFAVPMLQHLAKAKGMGLVLVPTRELAIQVNDVFRIFTGALKMETAVLIGGESISRQAKAVTSRTRVLICTPGRLNDHIERGNVHLNNVNFFVLDEADRMLDMGFFPQVMRILAHVPKARQTMLLSATMPDEIIKLSQEQMSSPVKIQIARSGTAAEKITQELYVVSKPAKKDLLAKMLEEYPGGVLVFVRTRYEAANIARYVKKLGHNAAELHSDRSLNQRRVAMDGFKSGKYRVLVATDIAARGIDVTDIGLVINFDLPDEPDNYVHRIGRTGRAGESGRAVTFARPDQLFEVRAIERMLHSDIPIKTHPGVPEEKFDGTQAGPLPKRPVERDQRRSFGGFRGGGRKSHDRNKRGGRREEMAPRHDDFSHMHGFMGSRADSSSRRRDRDERPAQHAPQGNYRQKPSAPAPRREAAAQKPVRHAENEQPRDNRGGHFSHFGKKADFSSQQHKHDSRDENGGEKKPSRHNKPTRHGRMEILKSPYFSDRGGFKKKFGKRRWGR